MESPITEVGYQSQCHNLGIFLIPLNVSLTNLLAPFWPHKVLGHYIDVNKLPHNIVNFFHYKSCFLLELWQPVNHNENTAGTGFVYKIN
jgi:hypothetical protein